MNATPPDGSSGSTGSSVPSQDRPSGTDGNDAPEGTGRSGESGTSATPHGPAASGGPDSTSTGPGPGMSRSPGNGTTDAPGTPGGPGGPEPGSGPGDGPSTAGASKGASASRGRAAAAAAEEGVRFALGTLTVLPVRVERWDREAARRGMEWAPLAGLLVGGAAAFVGLLALMSGVSSLPAAVLSVAVPAVLTRGLHLDGLADVADGLGSAKPADGALRVMKQPDIGPFGVVTLVLVLLAQVAVLDELYGQVGWAQGALGVMVAAVTARCAITLAARSGVPAARGEGLGAVVAGTVPVRAAALVAASLAVAATLLGAFVYWGDALHGAVTCLLAVLIGLTAAELLLQHCRRRFGGVTGDVFGALSETATTAALLAFALG
ncbi:hypothetical protein GCM10012287_40060 [Streptomyces daqingensis]|uniref:Adenosylcobinamide-GDP ribazoletransferase n=2 Tax=Streptomyces daqingensis TaxID=1472640 RepID=A0ABQ2MKB3_9ACTN|nr:hypothetical protein GCM10012287_40060 [Streptomyces daqingensis]